MESGSYEMHVKSAGNSISIELEYYSFFNNSKYSIELNYPNVPEIIKFAFANKDEIY